MDCRTNPSTHHKQTRPAAEAAKAPSAQSWTVPKASVVMTIATQIVRNASRLASVCRRLAVSADLTVTRARGCSTADSLESEVVIPNTAEDRANGIITAGRPIERHEDPFLFWFRFEGHRHGLPIVRART